MKKKIKILIDILIFVCLITLMGYHITNNLIHEILGTAVFILFVLHNILNFKWYLTLFKGKHDTKRNLHIVINLLLLIAFILTAVSGAIMSKSLYTFMNFKMAALSRRIHLIANAWTLVLVSIHLGLHITPITMKIARKLKNSDFEYGAYILIGIFLISGIYFFVSQGIIKDMTGITMFKSFDYEENSIVFYLKYLDIALTISIITNMILNFKNIKRREVK